MGVFAEPGLTLNAHWHMRGLESKIRQLSHRHGWPILSVNRALAQQLVDIPVRRRAAIASTILEDAIEELGSQVVMCTDVSLLFDPTLHLDPLALFRQLAREKRLVVAWPGSYADGTLAYGVPEHSHYRTWSVTDLHMIQLR